MGNIFRVAWSDGERERLKAWFQNGRTGNLSEILPGRTWEAIRRQANILGCYCGDKGRPRDMGICSSCGSKSRLSRGVIAPGLCSDCYGREYMRQRKHVRVRNDYWTPSEDAVLQQMWGNSTAEEIVAALPGRTWKGCWHRAHLLNLKVNGDAVQETFVDNETVRPKSYWVERAMAQEHEPIHPAVMELVREERRILRMIERRGAHRNV